MTTLVTRLRLVFAKLCGKTEDCGDDGDVIDIPEPIVVVSHSHGLITKISLWMRRIIHCLCRNSVYGYLQGIAIRMYEMYLRYCWRKTMDPLVQDAISSSDSDVIDVTEPIETVTVSDDDDDGQKLVKFHCVCRKCQ